MSTPLAGMPPKAFCKATSISVSMLYKLKNAGKVPFVKVGRRTVITVSPSEFLERMGREAA